MHLLKNVMRHLDAELFWIAQEAVSLAFKGQETARRVDIVKAVGRSIGSLLLSREPVDGISEKEFETLAYNFLLNMDESDRSKGSGYLAESLCEPCVMFFEMRKAGLANPYVSRNVSYPDFYPFGQEGGFCNPMKLKLLSDD